MISVLGVLAMVSYVGGSTDLTFVRHAETEANASGRYSSRTVDTFSERGEKQVDDLAPKLPRHFDLILVSPSPRAMNTILPYLQETGQKAYIWPLLYECCTGRRPEGAHPTSFGYGRRISLMSVSFRLLPGENRLPVSPDYNSGLAQVAAAVREFRSRFMKGSVLVVGHSGEGGHMLHDLAGVWIKLVNAKPFRLTIRAGDRVPSRP